MFVKTQLSRGAFSRSSQRFPLYSSEQNATQINQLLLKNHQFAINVSIWCAIKVVQPKMFCYFAKMVDKFVPPEK